MRKLEFSQHNFDVLHEAYDELKIKYEERGNSMRETEVVVRSLFLPYIQRIVKTVRGMPPEMAVVDIEIILAELNKHTPIGLP